VKFNTHIHIEKLVVWFGAFAKFTKSSISSSSASTGRFSWNL